MTNLEIVAAVASAMVAVGLAIWLIPRWQVHRWRRAGIGDEEKLAELGVQARSSITQAFGGLALVVTLAITAFQANETRRTADKTQANVNKSFRLAEQGQVSERFSRAVEQLGATSADRKPATDVRTGALFSLMRIGIDSEANRQPALLVVAAYATGNFVKPPSGRQVHECRADFRRQPKDVVTALRFVLHKIAAKLKNQDRLGLRGAKLNGLAVDGLILNRFDLTGVEFRAASLRRAQFRDARLAFAQFNRACLDGADFREATLVGATFAGASLKRAKFTRDDLARAPLTPAQKREVAVVP